MVKKFKFSEVLDDWQIEDFDSEDEFDQAHGVESSKGNCSIESSYQNVEIDSTNVSSVCTLTETQLEKHYDFEVLEELSNYTLLHPNEFLNEFISDDNELFAASTGWEFASDAPSIISINTIMSAIDKPSYKEILLRTGNSPRDEMDVHETNVKIRNHAPKIMMPLKEETENDIENGKGCEDNCTIQYDSHFIM
jgi:hypothetical protein